MEFVHVNALKRMPAGKFVEFARAFDADDHEHDVVVWQSAGGQGAFDVYTGEPINAQTRSNCRGCARGPAPQKATPTEAKSNPWAICTKSVGRDDKAKYERCVKKVKKSTGYHENVEVDPVEQIADLIDQDSAPVVENHDCPHTGGCANGAYCRSVGRCGHKCCETNYAEAIREDVAMMEPQVQEKPVEEIEAEMDALLAALGPEAPVKPEVEPEVEPGVVPDAPEPTEPDPFNPTQPAVDPHPKACEY